MIRGARTRPALRNVVVALLVLHGAEAVAGEQRDHAETRYALVLRIEAYIHDTRFAHSALAQS